MSNQTFAIKVVFRQGDYWSKPYTYKADTPFQKGSAVVVPSRGFYAVGKVVDCEEDATFNPAIDYKSIVIGVPK